MSERNVRSPVDLRSDTVTRPTPEMRAAMAQAEVGDDVYAEDPTVNALEAHLAGLLGHQAGLFCPTGSMANMLGVRLLGGHAALGQVTTRTWHSSRGLLDADAALAMATPDAGPHLVSTAAFAVENTHNFGGGSVQPLTELRRLRAGANALGIAVHLDGARLWNAHVATGTPLGEYGACADTVSVCLSKGLGAPVGSVLVASAERVARARVWRKRYGGGMRQVGVLAAAGRYAVDHHVARLADDHARARALATMLAEVDPRLCNPLEVDTNMVVVNLAPLGLLAADVAAATRASGVLTSVVGPRTLRLVTHLDADDAAVEVAGAVLRAVFAEALTGRPTARI
jgi:threonine aldolase